LAITRSILSKSVDSVLGNVGMLLAIWGSA
jgi:hypothetical protein